MSIRTKAMNRARSFRLSIASLSDEATTEPQLQELRALMTAIEGVERLIESSRALGINASTQRSPFNFGGLVYAGDHFEVPPGRVGALRIAASAWSKAHGVRLTVNKLDGQGGRCTRMDGPQAPAGDTF